MHLTSDKLFSQCVNAQFFWDSEKTAFTFKNILPLNLQLKSLQLC